MANALPKIYPTEGTVIALFPNGQPEQPEQAQKLKKDGTPKKICSNKKAGVSSEVFAFDFEDAKKILDYFRDNEKWIHYLLFTITCNMARRVGDTLDLKWRNFYNPATGKMRDNIFIQEEKTGKLSHPHINDAIRDAIALYIEKTGCDPSIENYSRPVFYQLSGTHKGKVLSYSACIKTLKKAAADVGIEYNVGMHSTRKTFGAMTRALHPGDYDCMDVLQGMYKHSSAQMTSKYIGLTKQREDNYYDDMGAAFQSYVAGDKTFSEIADKPVISLDVNDLRSIISMAYESGLKHAGCTDAMVHVNAQNEIMCMVDGLVK